ncbi:DNA-binding transcriptional regulator, MocR family, contains an aminotransferase domain [Bowdeniella nasicola]|uniref:DNA-binding transcriptional regulator, MocR family, contains an aminotransferase domain n=2 Tax=Actinomycetaceae TaxID=2049 RepID=A0A1H4CRL4_9ACTO|nr:PLP-dependent aminotransferase family protein [Bowdeniella nasicola]SEA63033.1 DNA-binding transcriptional regulator, MocR family, contains an aminotransferase domain [Bowdeniella nasicola]
MSTPSHGTRLDPWFDSYAERAHGMRSSEIRALFAVASRPEVVSLAGGMPNLSSLPMDHIAEISARLLRDRGTRALQYGSGQGEVETREAILDVMQYDSIRVHPDDVVVTTGSQQALDLVTEIFIDPGDVIVAEAPSYVGALGVFRAYQADVVHTPMDDDGLIPEELDATLTRLKSEGRRVKLLYTVPNYHNPAGVTLSLERRPQIVEICRKHHVLILEDNPYGLLGFHSDPMPALKSFDPDGVIYLGSFSKMFGPGYRIGWAAAPHAVREKLVLASESAILCPSQLGQLSIVEYLNTWDWYGQVKQYRGEYRTRAEAMMSALSEYLPMCEWTKPEGGFYTWVTLPDGLDAKAMLPRAVKNLVAYVSGTAFYTDGQGGDHMRLSFCYPTPEAIREGVRRLSQVVRSELETVELFGTNIRPDAEAPPREGGNGRIDTPTPDQV